MKKIIIALILILLAIPAIDFYSGGKVKQIVTNLGTHQDPIEASEDYIINQFEPFTVDSITLEDIINDRDNMLDFDESVEIFKKLPIEIIKLITDKIGTDIGYYNIGNEYRENTEYYINEFINSKLPEKIDLSSLPNNENIKLKATIDSVIPELTTISSQ